MPDWPDYQEESNYMSFFTVRELTTNYGDRTIIKTLSFSVDAGCMFGILGTNGSGKTTLLKSICGIVPHSGSCSLDNTVLDDLSARKLAQLCSYIPQRSGIAIDISALDVVLMGYNPQLRLLENPSATMKDMAHQMLERVGLGGREQDSYLTLSEGQKQLCILARTLITSSKLLLLDEPESALDFHFRYQMLEAIRSWVAQEQRAAIVALHDPALALNECDRLLLLCDGKQIGILSPACDSIETMEQMLSRLYGAVNLTVCRDRNGNKHLVMLNEREKSVWRL